MLNTRASERYAKSLLSLSIDKNIVNEINSDIDLIIKSFEDSREVANLYSSPIIPINHKIEITNKFVEPVFISEFKINVLCIIKFKGLKFIKI